MKGDFCAFRQVKRLHGDEDAFDVVGADSDGTGARGRSGVAVGVRGSVRR